MMIDILILIPVAFAWICIIGLIAVLIWVIFLFSAFFIQLLVILAIFVVLGAVVAIPFVFVGIMVYRAYKVARNWWRKK